jgi:hypothetical protein
VNTVDDNKSKYTNPDYSRAALARKRQNIIARPSTQTYMHIIDNNLMPNCPIGRNDIIAAGDIFGPNLGSLKCKTTQTASKHVRGEHMNIPINIMGQYRHVTIACVTIACNIIFVNKIPFFMTISRHIKFGTAEMIKSQKAVTLLKAIKQVKSAYMKQGFNITHLLVDGQFKPLRQRHSTWDYPKCYILQ